MKIKLLNGSLLTILLVASGVVHAGQTVKQFNLKQSLKNSGIFAYWVDTNKEPFGRGDPMLLEQTIESEAYIAIDTYDPDYIGSLVYLGIHDKADSPQTDVRISGNSDKTDQPGCKFEADSNNYLYCKVKITAAKDSPLGNQRKSGWDTPQDQTVAVDIGSAYDQDLEIYPHTIPGTIEADGPDGQANDITAIAVTESEPTKDNVKVTIRVVGAEGAKTAKLKFKTLDSKVATTETGSCDIDISSGSGSCTVNLTPYNMDHTQLDFTGSTYTTNTEEKPYTGLPKVEIHVGTLYAGYTKGQVRRKFSEQSVAGTASVRSLAVNEADHKLYSILNNRTLYSQQGATTGSLNLQPQVQIPGDDKNGFQILTLSNNSDEELIGDGYGKVNRVVGSTYTLLNPAPESSFNSLIAATIDQKNNIVYMADRIGTLGKYVAGNLIEYKNIIPDKYQSDINLAANQNLLYVSLNSTKTGHGSLYKWVNDHLEAISVGEPDPFATAKIKFLAFSDLNPTHMADLYAGSSDGSVYVLDRTTNKWKLVVKLSNSAVNDVVFDNNGTMYVAVKNKIWRLKADPGETATELTEYTKDSNDIQTLVIDNNGIGKTPPPPTQYTWKTAFTPLDGFSPGMVISSNNMPYAASTLTTGQIAISGILSGSSWSSLGNPGYTVASNPGLALGANNSLYVSFRDSETYKMTVMKSDGMSASWSAVGQEGFSPNKAGVNSSLAVSKNNIVYTAFKEVGTNLIKVMQYTNNWNNIFTGDVSQLTGNIGLNALQLDQNDVPYLTFVNDKISAIQILKYDSNTWEQIGSVISGANPGFNPSIAFDSTSTPYIAYVTDNNFIKVVKYDKSSNVWADIGDSQGIAKPTPFSTVSLLMISNIPFIAFQNADSGYAIIVKRFINNSWEFVGNSTGVASGLNPGFAVGPDNLPYVAFEEIGTGKITVMKSEVVQ